MKAIKLTVGSAVLAMVLAMPHITRAAPPGAGEILQQMKPATPPAPSPSELELMIQKAGGVTLPASASFLVKKIVITGNTLFDTQTLHALVADGEGKQITLAELGQLASRITDYYHSHGYPLARAIVPAQEIKTEEASVTIKVIEAKFGKISLDNQSGVDTWLLAEALTPLKEKEFIEQKKMEHALLLLSDIPGISFQPVLKPGDKAGTSDLFITATSAPVFSAIAVLDNYGNKYTGRERLSAGANFANPLGHGDVLSFSGLTSGAGMDNVKLGYETLLSGLGTRAGTSYSALHYSLGGAFSNLRAKGTADVGSAWVKHPFSRSRDFNLYGQLQYDRLMLADHIDATATKTDRHLDNWTARLFGDARDASGLNIWSFEVTSGRVGFEDATARAVDAATANTQGSFAKWNLNLSRLEPLWEKTTLYVNLSGQWANSNLDSSQQMSAGGPYTVRAYDIGALSGDTGYLGTLELRQRMSQSWQAVAFWDAAHVEVNKNAWVTGTNNATLSGAGIGLDWSHRDWFAKAYVASRTGPRPVLVADSSNTRIWVQVGRGF